MTDEPITISGVFQISRDGRFRDTVTGDDISAAIEGIVTPGGTASGTLVVDLLVVHGRADVECSSGVVRWEARLT